MAGSELKTKIGYIYRLIPLYVPRLAGSKARCCRSSGQDPSGWLVQGRVHRHPTEENPYHE